MIEEERAPVTINALSVSPSPISENADLNALLISLDRYGQTRLNRMDNGWYAAIEMNTNTTGSSFKVASEFNCKTPENAVRQLIERMQSALRKLGGAA